MKITVLTLFKELFDMYLSQTILDRAVNNDLVEYDIVNIRDYSTNSYHQVDDTPFGGGAGMLLKPEPFFKYFFSLKEENRKPYVVFVTPQGNKLNQERINKLKEKEDLVIISGRYEGLDQRVIDRYVDEEISIGDFVLTSGDLPALCLIDAITRQKDGVITKESYETDSFYNGLLGYPQYTKPSNLGRHKVPEVLLSGDHKRIREFRFKESVKKTIKNRPDLIAKKLEEDEDFRKMIEDLL
ncbi:tRNA (guanosine(37)-N1)-methyltransferase TrmD [uncultured Sneathia sp.]|uniref:tRNA (guanosine(37)-N1)-methyltransferase TrmD n=1 Tax=uncultured Sneathia sp. TaxID=278067 RepID=UPI0025996C9D|nr:tRNA (guanosine(37)-N1)-methyltransferase TrmD [uncultured Sneathia sp.]